MEWKLLKAIGCYLVYTDGALWTRDISRKWDGRFSRALTALEYVLGRNHPHQIGMAAFAALVVSVGGQEAEIFVRFLHEEVRRSGPRITWEAMERLRTALLAHSR